MSRGFLKYSLLHTLLELGHAISQNLGFAYGDAVTSYGEETITETNLLEIRRRHPEHVNIISYSKRKESHNTGADWEWHIIGRKLKHELRVQAKRVTKAGKIHDINRQAPTAPSSQIDLLIQSAQNESMRPIYCFYCAEKDRSFWKTRVPHNGYTAYEMGCLIADAHTVRNKMPTNLAQIELDTVPWHYLCRTGVYGHRLFPQTLDIEEGLTQIIRTDFVRGEMPEKLGYPDRPEGLRFPTFDDLNQPDGREFDHDGVSDSDPDEFSRDIGPEELEERGVARLVLIDVRSMDSHNDEVMRIGAD